MKSVEVFISYHQEDETLRQELEKHLASLRRENIITKLERSQNRRWARNQRRN
ncbi:hypothetical protein [Nostoc sp. FACHB-133]|uniref:hypothetical protein n=1 Tax=Nostoc sp. FACHB-133 TaxID=2692835 RepID=UPI00168668D7|nr:hypothetical protein [Nostoc sp. FACHB-133]MBD2524921.1 hypothetical protein [Nostoc sp. FACHB-133]